MTDITRELSSLTSKLQDYHVEEQGLSFSGRTLKLNNEKDAEVVTDEMDRCKNLVMLNLDGNTVGIDAAKKISQSLSKHSEFKRAIWKNMFTSRTKEEIPPALEHLGAGIIAAKANLVELDLSDNAFGPIGVEGLANLIQSPSFRTLQELRLNNNGLGISGGKLLAKALEKCYESSGQKFALRVFQAGRNRLENPGAEALSRVFKMIRTLTEVSMPQNGIYSVGVTALSEAFKCNPHLKVINLNDNTVQKKGAKAIASALPALQNLEILNLGDCLLKTDGAINIAKALTETHRNLKILVLGHNEISMEGGMEVMKAIENKNNLHTLDLNGNKFGRGIDQLEKESIKFERRDALQSFSEDEGSEEDDEESASEDEQNESYEHDYSTVSNDSSVDNSSSKLDDSVPEKVTVAEFLSSPSCKNFSELGSNKVEQFLNYIETSEKDDLVKNCLTILLNVSNLCENNQDIIKNQALICSIQLYKYLFTWAEKNDKLSLVTNAVLVQLRLIKAEEKNNLLDCNPKICHSILEKAMSHGDTIPKSSRDMFDIFLHKRNESLQDGHVSTIL